PPRAYRCAGGQRPSPRRGRAGPPCRGGATPGAPAAPQDESAPAFTDAECDAVREWVRGGGALLLIADHAPFGTTAANLGKRFGVDMGKGFAYDRANSAGGPTILVFSRENGLLGGHPVVPGRG